MRLCDFANLLCVFPLPPLPTVSQEQYVFIHDAILEACLCGETAIPVNEFALTYKEMLKVDSQSNTSQLREEFQVILYLCMICLIKQCLNLEISLSSLSFHRAIDLAAALAAELETMY